MKRLSGVGEHSGPDVQSVGGCEELIPVVMLDMDAPHIRVNAGDLKGRDIGDIQIDLIHVVLIPDHRGFLQFAAKVKGRLIERGKTAGFAAHRRADAFPLDVVRIEYRLIPDGHQPEKEQREYDREQNREVPELSDCLFDLRMFFHFKFSIRMDLCVLPQPIHISTPWKDRARAIRRSNWSTINRGTFNILPSKLRLRIDRRTMIGVWSGYSLS